MSARRLILLPLAMMLAGLLPRILATVEDGRARRVASRIIPRAEVFAQVIDENGHVYGHVRQHGTCYQYGGGAGDGLAAPSATFTASSTTAAASSACVGQSVATISAALASNSSIDMTGAPRLAMSAAVDGNARHAAAPHRR